jgi:hypothetical protein
MDAELMLTPHTFVHGVAKGYGRFIAGMYGRQTDDCAGRSAPFDQFDPGLSQNQQRLITYISNPENTLYGLLKSQGTVIDAGFFNLRASCAGDFWLKRRASTSNNDRCDSHYNRNRADNDGGEQPCGSLRRLWALGSLRFTHEIPPWMSHWYSDW